MRRRDVRLLAERNLKRVGFVSFDILRREDFIIAQFIIHRLMLNQKER
jgi:hypothetical protein